MWTSPARWYARRPHSPPCSRSQHSSSVNLETGLTLSSPSASDGSYSFIGIPSPSNLRDWALSSPYSLMTNRRSAPWQLLGLEGEALADESFDENLADAGRRREDAGQIGQPVVVERECQRRLTDHDGSAGVSGVLVSGDAGL